MTEVPPAVVTVTSIVPAPAGLRTTTWVAVSLTILAAVLPKCTDAAFARYVPLMVTIVPPVAGPCEALISVTAGDWKLIERFWVAKPSVPVVGRVKSLALPARS